MELRLFTVSTHAQRVWERLWNWFSLARSKRERSSIFGNYVHAINKQGQTHRPVWPYYTAFPMLSAQANWGKYHLGSTVDWWMSLICAKYSLTFTAWIGQSCRQISSFFMQNTVSRQVPFLHDTIALLILYPGATASAFSVMKGELVAIWDS